MYYLLVRTEITHPSWRKHHLIPVLGKGIIRDDIWQIWTGELCSNCLDDGRVLLRPWICFTKALWKKTWKKEQKQPRPPKYHVNHLNEVAAITDLYIRPSHQLLLSFPSYPAGPPGLFMLIEGGSICERWTLWSAMVAVATLARSTVMACMPGTIRSPRKSFPSLPHSLPRSLPSFPKEGSNATITHDGRNAVSWRITGICQKQGIWVVWLLTGNGNYFSCC